MTVKVLKVAASLAEALGLKDGLGVHPIRESWTGYGIEYGVIINVPSGGMIAVGRREDDPDSRVRVISFHGEDIQVVITDSLSFALSEVRELFAPPACGWLC